MKKLTRKIIFSLVVLIIIGAPLLYLTLLNANKASASWFDNNWAYFGNLATIKNI